MRKITSTTCFIFAYLSREENKEIHAFNLSKATEDNIKEFLRSFADNLEFCIYLSLYQKSGLKSPRILRKEYEDKNEQIVHNCQIAYKFPIYGFSTDKKPFIRIEFYDARHIKRCSNMLHSGVLYGQPLQPYEAHLSYFMHFFGDYHLSGMDFIKVIDFYLKWF
ncbi:dna polymerase zeta catalytic subunit-like [Stylonychia lemnae]|uniref:Dna polymerase zeta catalytic subunit-like n=1 Tax=Stylonychia lemnae TaxID=5949 RepID=A0A078AAI1_STYLE|nr:dna polymerase zeta catalytic subunit-like [Stylonychia lemnae]|eukprot:CDW78587.1 dna polymerase zeta catalytic subunit-like [Stylonychia lemnae]